MDGFENNNSVGTQSKPSVVWLILAVVGALIVIVSFFLAFISASALGFTETESGMKMLSDGDLTYWKYLPLITVILAVIALIVAVVKKNTGARGALIGLGAVMVLLTVFFIYTVDSGMIVSDEQSLSELLKGLIEIGVGVYVTIIGAIVVIIAGLLPTKA